MRRRIVAFSVAVSLVAIDDGRAEVAAQNARTKIDFVLNGMGVPPADFEFWRTGGMDFGAKTATYVDTFMETIRWANVDRLFDKVCSV